MRAVIAFCIEILVDTKLMPRPAAGEFVAAAATKLGMRGEGCKRISGATANGYRDTICGTGTKGTTAAFMMMITRRAVSCPLPTSLSDAQAEVHATLTRFVEHTGY